MRTAFLFGTAVGQLVLGPLSDRYGRRRPILTGAAVCTGGVLAAQLALLITRGGTPPPGSPRDDMETSASAAM